MHTVAFYSRAGPTRCGLCIRVSEIYTFWKYFRNAFARDAGLRIDHLLLSPPSAKRLVSAGVDREVRAREHASDHAPAWIELAEPPKASPGRARPLKRES